MRIQAKQLFVLGLLALGFSLPAHAGTLVGKAVVGGEYQLASRRTMDADALILAQRSVVVSDKGGIANVAVSVENVPGSFEPREASPELDQKEKTFVPHVLPVVRGHSVDFVNSDQILHNIHAYQGDTTLFNTAMPFQGQRLPFEIQEEAGELEVVCDVHKHMRAWIVVRDNPFFAVSKETGLFSIEGVPAGTYTVRAWHEVFGELEQTVTILEGDEKTPVLFKFPVS